MNFSKYALTLLLCIGTICLSACKPQNVKIDEKFIDTYIDLRVAENVYGRNSSDARIARKKILKDAGYKREDFIKTIDWLFENDEQWLTFQKAVVDRIDTLMANKEH